MPRTKRTISFNTDTLTLAQDAAGTRSLSEYVDRAVREALARDGGAALSRLYDADPDYRTWCAEAAADTADYLTGFDTGTAA